MPDLGADSRAAFDQPAVAGATGRGRPPGLPGSTRPEAALEHDPLLLQVAETPFYLNCLQLLFRGGNTLSELKFSGATVEERQAEITEQFVEQALAKPSKHGSPEQVRRWLAFLASRMTQRNKVVFELVDLQYDWWKWITTQSRQRWFMHGFVYVQAGSLFFGLFIGFLLSVVAVRVLGVTYGILFSIKVGLAFYFITVFLYATTSVLTGRFRANKPIIETKDKAVGSRKNYLQTIKKNLSALLFLGISAGFFVSIFWGLISTMVWMLFWMILIVRLLLVMENFSGAFTRFCVN